MTDLNLIDTDTLAAACRTAAVSSAHADLLNAAAARLLAQASWIDGAKVDLDGYDEARAESQRATAWHMEALDDLAACVAERDDWRRRYEAVDTWVRENCREWDVDDGETVTTPLDELVESISIWREDHTRQKRRYEALAEEGHIEGDDGRCLCGAEWICPEWTKVVSDAWQIESLTDEVADLRRRYEALRDGVTGLLLVEWEVHYFGGSPPEHRCVAVEDVRAVVARVEES